MSSYLFSKWEATGNDLILVDARISPVTHPALLAREMCTRHMGIGSDGLLLVESAAEGVPLMRMFNPDGTEDFCGNGIRCVAAYLVAQGDTSREIFLRTPRGEHHGRVRPLNGFSYQSEMEIFKPIFNPPEVPVDLPTDQVMEFPIRIEGSELLISSLRVGSTHTVIFCDDISVSEADFMHISPLLENHPAFPERTSVLWCKMVTSREMEMRIWERGVGETYSCGTGACAAAVVANLTNRAGSYLEISTRGGQISVQWNGNDAVRLTGPVRQVFSGKWQAHGSEYE